MDTTAMLAGAVYVLDVWGVKPTGGCIYVVDFRMAQVLKAEYDASDDERKARMVPCVNSDLTDLALQVDHIHSDMQEALLHLGQAIVCCRHGRSRSPSIVASFLVARRGYARERASAAIDVAFARARKDVRNTWALSGGPNLSITHSLHVVLNFEHVPDRVKLQRARRAKRDQAHASPAAPHKRCRSPQPMEPRSTPGTGRVLSYLERQHRDALQALEDAREERKRVRYTCASSAAHQELSVPNDVDTEAIPATPPDSF